MIGNVKKFISEVVTELKKVSWTNRKELREATYLVILSSLFLGLFIGAVDFVLSKFISLLF
jgi:preprotein translocase subunit SecE